MANSKGKIGLLAPQIIPQLFQRRSVSLAVLGRTSLGRGALPCKRGWDSFAQILSAFMFVSEAALGCLFSVLSLVCWPADSVLSFLIIWERSRFTDKFF